MCMAPTSIQVIKEQKLNENYVKKCDSSLRLLMKPNYQFIEHVVKGQRQYQAIIILPPCIKNIVNYCNSKISFSRKKDAEGYICLQVIEALHKKNILNDYLHLQKSYQKPASTIFRTDNAYISKPLHLNFYQQQCTLYLHLFTGKNQSCDYYPYKTPSSGITKHHYGFLSDRNLNHLNLDYQLMQDNRQRHLNIDFLMTHSDMNRNTALENTQSKIIIDYSMNHCIKLQLHLENRINMIQKLKFFHVWSFYQMMSIDQTFLKGILKDNFSFSRLLFSDIIDHLWNRHSTILGNLLKCENLEQHHEDIEEVHIYILPITGIHLENQQSKYELNLTLIEDTIRHVKTQLLTLIEKPQFQPGSFDVNDIGRGHMLWNQSTGNNGYKLVFDSKKADEKVWNQLSFQIPQGQVKVKNSEFFLKGDKTTLPQFYCLSHGNNISQLRSSHFIKFQKLSQFIDVTPNKSSLGKIKSEQKIAEQKLTNIEEIMLKGPLNEDSINDHWVPSEVVEVDMLNYEQFANMQQVCSHLLKLNDFLRTEQFILKYFSDTSFCIYPTQSKFLNLSPPSPSSVSEVRSMLFRNLPLINAALTSPATQILNNNERLEIYGNSVISLLAIIEIYLTRESSYTENDLDYLKKQRISIDKFIRINTEHKIYEYMMVEPQIQQTQIVGEKQNNSIMRSVTPGGLGGIQFQNMIKLIKKENIEA